MNRDHWLVISYFANVKGACQSEWIEDRIAALARLGIGCSLLSSFCGGRYPGMRHLRAPSLSPADLKYELDFSLKRNGVAGRLFDWLRVLIFLPLYPLYWLETKVLNVYGESRWSWMPMSILTGLALALFRRPSLIYTTGGPASAHIVGTIIARLTGCPLVCELQDPLVGDDIGRNALSKKGLAVIERWIFAGADRVIFCTRAASDSAASRQASEKAVCIYPGSLAQGSPDPVGRAPGERCRFVYLGSLYQTRNLDRFMAALDAIFRQHPELGERVQLDVYGNMNEDIRRRILAFPYPVISLKGLVPRDEALRQALQSDVLLLVQNTDDRSSTTIPFKTYDYLLSGRKVLGLIYKNPELEQMLTGLGHLAVAADDSEAIRETLLVLLEKWRARALEQGIRRSPLTVDSAALAMVELARGVAALREEPVRSGGTGGA